MYEMYFSGKLNVHRWFGQPEIVNTLLKKLLSKPIQYNWYYKMIRINFIFNDCAKLQTKITQDFPYQIVHVPCTNSSMQYLAKKNAIA